MGEDFCTCLVFVCVDSQLTLIPIIKSCAKANILYSVSVNTEDEEKHKIQNKGGHVTPQLVINKVWS
jgi:hypothetical protein